MNEDLIKKYFSGDCSETEKKQIYLYFRENPDEFLGYFSEKEWHAMQGQDVLLSDATSIEPEDSLSEFMIKEQWYARRYDKRRRVRKLGLIAAMVCCLFVSGYFYLHFQKTKGGHRAVVAAAAFVALNETSKTKQIELPDHSIVHLFPGSKISYSIFNKRHAREVVLTGSAIFKVVHNSQMPFTVFCQRVATTAIGTKFKIVTQNHKKVEVKLLEGKVLVRSTLDKADRARTFYLMAGNSISFDRETNEFQRLTSAVVKPGLSSTRPDVAKASDDVQSSKVVTTNSGTRFEGKSLKDVLDFLAKKFNTKIIYPTSAIDRILFVGTIHYNEQIEIILQNIALMNKLKLAHDTTNNVFTLKQF